MFPMIQGSHGINNDAKSVNPGFSLGDFEHTNNCQRTVNAYVMRRNGFDVVAKGLSEEAFPTDELASQAWSAWDGAQVEFHSSQAEAEASMAKWGDGAIAIVKVNWRDSGAHYFIAEQVNGKTVFLDPQDGTVGCENYFEIAQDLFFMSRVDHLEPSSLMRDAVEAKV